MVATAGVAFRAGDEVGELCRKMKYRMPLRARLAGDVMERENDGLNDVREG